MARQRVFDNFIGGLNQSEPSTIKDNELAKAENVFYNEDNRLTSRKGVQDIFTAIPDVVTVIADMNAFDGDGTWVGAGDCGNVTTDANVKKYDAGSVNFDITVTGTSGTMTNTTITAVDLTATKEEGYFTAWVYLPSVTNFTSVTLTLGDTLDSDDYELAVTTNAKGEAFAVGWNLLKWTWADMTSDGSPTGSIDEIRFTFTFDAAFVTDTDFRIDGIFWNSGTVQIGADSIYHVKLDDGTRVTMASCGGNVFLLENDNDWVLLADGYTSGEKFSFLNYKSIIYFSNGTDNFSYYEPANESSAGSVVTEDAAAPKAKYLMMVANTAYCAGISGSLNEVKYTAAIPGNLQNAAWANNEFIYDDDAREIITGMSKLPSDAIAVYLERSSYYVDTVPATTVIRPLDYDGGCIAWRTIRRVGNDTFFLAEDALYSLNQRQGDSGTFGAQTLSDNVDVSIKSVEDFSSANAFRGKRVRPNHYYLNLDTSNSGKPDMCLVYNIKLGAWTEYTNVAANQMAEYEDASGNWHILYANAFSGQIREIESSYDDNDVEITAKVWTKENDFGDPTVYKDIRECDLSGLISESADIEVTDAIDDEDNSTATINGSDFSDESVGVSTPLGTVPVGTSPLTGGDVTDGDMTLNPFNVRKNIYQPGYKVQLKLQSSTTGSQWSLSKVQYQVEALPISYFPNSNYI
jgi:hypothetical protein